MIEFYVQRDKDNVYDVKIDGIQKKKKKDVCIVFDVTDINMKKNNNKSNIVELTNVKVKVSPSLHSINVFSYSTNFCYSERFLHFYSTFYFAIVPLISRILHYSNKWFASSPSIPDAFNCSFSSCINLS